MQMHADEVYVVKYIPIRMCNLELFMTATEITEGTEIT